MAAAIRKCRCSNKKHTDENIETLVNSAVSKVYSDQTTKNILTVQKPIQPLSRVIKEGTLGTCPKCYSTEIKKHNILGFKFGPKIGCINPECVRYYKRKISL